MTSFGASWELRCGFNNGYRVFYAVRPEEVEVFIVAIAKKIGNKLFIGGKEFKILRLRHWLR
jgi:putative component of toxin-antitoxin plasmid stabilization module